MDGTYQINPLYLDCFAENKRSQLLWKMNIFVADPFVFDKKCSDLSH